MLAPGLPYDKRAQDGRFLCFQWHQNQTCLFGTQCRFAHGVGEPVVVGPQEWESFDLDSRANAEHMLGTSDVLSDEIMASKNVAELVQRFAAFLFWGLPVRPKLGEARRKKLVALFEETLVRMDEAPESSSQSSPSSSSSSSEQTEGGPALRRAAEALLRAQADQLQDLDNEYRLIIGKR